MRAVNPFRSVAAPLGVGSLLGVIGFVLALPWLAVVGSLLLVALSLRVAYNHRGAARYTLPQRNPSKPVWWRQQMTGAALFFLAVWFVVGSLRNHLS
jgi:hypothetical protein